MRIRVKDVLDLLAAGVPEKEILEDYPDLAADDIRACLEYRVRSDPNESCCYATSRGSRRCQPL